MKTLDLFNSKFERNLHEGATDSCTSSADVNAQMKSLVERARACSTMEERAGLMREYAALKETAKGYSLPASQLPGKQELLKTPVTGFEKAKAAVKDTVKGMMGRKDVEHFGSGRSVDEGWFDTLANKLNPDSSDIKNTQPDGNLELNRDLAGALKSRAEINSPANRQKMLADLTANAATGDPRAISTLAAFKRSAMSETQKKSSEDLGLIKDPAVQQAIKQARIRFPSADSDVEAFIKDTETHLDQDEQEIDQEQELNSRQEAMLQHIMDLDKKQSSDINDIKGRLSSVNKRLNDVLGKIQSKHRATKDTINEVDPAVIAHQEISKGGPIFKSNPAGGGHIDVSKVVPKGMPGVGNAGYKTAPGTPSMKDMGPAVPASGASKGAVVPTGSAVPPTSTSSTGKGLMTPPLQIAKEAGDKPGWALDPKTKLELKRRQERQKTIAKYAGKDIPKQDKEQGVAEEASRDYLKPQWPDQRALPKAVAKLLLQYAKQNKKSIKQLIKLPPVNLVDVIDEVDPEFFEDNLEHLSDNDFNWVFLKATEMIAKSIQQQGVAEETREAELNRKFNTPDQLKKDADYRAYRAGVKASRKQPPAPIKEFAPGNGKDPFDNDPRSQTVNKVQQLLDAGKSVFVLLPGAKGRAVGTQIGDDHSWLNVQYKGWKDPKTRSRSRLTVNLKADDDASLKLLSGSQFTDNKDRPFDYTLTGSAKTSGRGLFEVTVDEGWSGNEPTWVCVNGKRWKKFPTHDHARNVGDKLQAKFRKEGSKDQVSYLSTEADNINEDQQLHTGDPVIVVGNNEFNGTTGEIAEFSPSGKFVIVDLYNHGKQPMHLSDVKYNEYADKDELDEVSKQTLGSYVKRAGQDVIQRATSSSYQSGAAGDKYNRAEPGQKELRRERGIERAISKLTK